MKDSVHEQRPADGAAAGFAESDAAHCPPDYLEGELVPRDLASAQGVIAALQTRATRQQARIDRLETTNRRLEHERSMLTVRDTQVYRFAYFDELTGLPNRRLLNDRLHQAMAQGARHDRLLALILIDLDDFKSINDRLGHVAGDRVLCAVGARLSQTTRDADTTCRYGGDEFVTMLPEVEDIRVIDAIAGKLQAAIAAPYRIDGYDVRMTASIGRVVFPFDGESLNALMRSADRGLYRAKRTRSPATITSVAVR